MHMMMMWMMMLDLLYVWKETHLDYWEVVSRGWDKHHMSVPFVTSQWAGSEKQSNTQKKKIPG